ncbi:hypothetical protein TSOC111612_23895 [Tsukamurella ocularis]|uniref:hypothetical protein n=1 Tax=Tsukamurella ocularis TaxID=1970234 RepID=UPI0039F06D2B
MTMTTTTDRSIRPHGTTAVWGRCGMCATPATRWAAGSTTAVHMWVCADHADSYIRADS